MPRRRNVLVGEWKMAAGDVISIGGVLNYIVWLLKREEQRKLLTLEMDYLMRSASVSRLQTPPLGAKYKHTIHF